MSKKILLIVFSLTMLCSCIRSLHPIYSEDTAVYRPELAGNWIGDEADEYWFFSPVNDSHYKLIISDDDKIQGPFEAHLCEVNGIHFLDLYPAKESIKDDGFFEFHFLPVHTFLYIQQIEPTLIMSFPNPDWLDKFLNDNPGEISRETVGDEIILTASPFELQQFWSKHVDTENAFGEPKEIKKAGE
jgi:hypothetical protein